MWFKELGDVNKRKNTCWKKHKTSVLWLAGVNLTANLEAQPGQDVTIECSYPTTARNTVKHFCREEENLTCLIKISVFETDRAIRDRFSIKDRKAHGVYAVTISALSENDSGRYRCFMEDVSNDKKTCLKKVSLIVSGEENIFHIFIATRFWLLLYCTSSSN